MTAYKIKYQLRRKEITAVPQGEWQDKEEVIVDNDDATGAIDEIADSFPSHDFRLRGVEVLMRIDSIALNLVDELSTWKDE